MGMLYLLESEQYGEDRSVLIVDKDKNLLLENVNNGFVDYREEIEWDLKL